MQQDVAGTHSYTSILSAQLAVSNVWSTCTNTAEQRFKDAVDNRIQEEQAKQKTTSVTASPRASTSRQRSGSRNISPSMRRPRREQDVGERATMPIGKEVDPSEFEPEFVIGEEGDTSTQPSRVPTPAQPAMALTSAPAPSTNLEVETTSEIKETGSSTPELKKDGVDVANQAPATPQELPMDVRQRLRKLERLEPKYSGLHIH